MEHWEQARGIASPDTNSGSKCLRHAPMLPAFSLEVIEKMERETGFEPATSSLGKWVN